ncbi:erythrocyte membrane protein 3 [Plasmodium cynomolgi strain B]|uniref:Erythrocyte membrane protein 3 n=1 Tax=Plasmodium cynomolgi (strain B) TaxID=1120755 RepID=K6UZS3_PLACD|nr:erythrocyte membrane protein 3 [Plasmodium cynomolgi strain B]GAB68225.1 erythrocyte membrane protein 3 [Plasmodium cynomolgi strain B]
MPHNFEASVASRYDRSLAENIGYTQSKANKLENRNGTPATAGNEQRGTHPTGLKVNTETIKPTKLALKSSTAHTGMSVKNEKARSIEYTLKGTPHTDLNINKKKEEMQDNHLTRTPPGGLKDKMKDQSVTHSLKNSPPTELQVNKKDELANGSLKDTPQNKPHVSKKDKSANNSLGNTKQSASKVNKKSDVTRDKPPVGTAPHELKINKRSKRSTEKENTIKNGLTEYTLKGDHMEGLKVNNKSIRSSVQSLIGASPTGLKVSNEEVQSVDGPAELAPPSKLNVNEKEKTVPNSLKMKIPGALTFNKKGEHATNSPKEPPADALEASNKDEPANHSSEKAKTFESEDNAKNNDLPVQKLSELLPNQKDNKTPGHTSMQVARDQLNGEKKIDKPNNDPFKNAPPSGLMGSKRTYQLRDLKWKNKPSNGLVGNQTDTKSQTCPLKNISKSDSSDNQKESLKDVLKNIPARKQNGNEKDPIKEFMSMQKNKLEVDVNVRELERDNQKCVEKVYEIKRDKRFKDNQSAVIRALNDQIFLQLQESEKSEKSDKPYYPFDRKIPDLKEYNESNISKDYQLKNKQPDIKEYKESNISKDYQLQNKSHNLNAYNEGHLAKENQLTHSAPAGLKEFETPDETRDYGLKGYTDSELKESELKESELKESELKESELMESELKESIIKEPQIDDQSSNQTTEENINALPDETVSIVAKENNANTQGNVFGMLRNIPSDIDQIERIVHTVFRGLKENNAGDIEEYIETHETKRYKLEADVKDGIKEYDLKFEKAGYGYREKLPVTEVQEYDVVERIYDKPIRVEKEKIKPIEHYTYTYGESQPKPPPKNYGLLDFFSFTWHLLSDRNVYLVEKDNLSLYKLGKKAMKGQLTDELIHEYLANCTKQKLKEEKVKNKHKLKIKEEKGKEKGEKKEAEEKGGVFKNEEEKRKIGAKGDGGGGRNTEGKKTEKKEAEAKNPKVNKTEVKKTAVKENNEGKKKPEERTSKTSQLKKK